ncbi:uncharacterized protein AB675_2748 [Cyphellophora attinorum]|uniref:Endoplasmic reticulum lectin n=1 Tax=Cyphellophora attinorum TaxID=1664694 RepID=A0A0N1P371_9EURO|nr:uncharacterized protein AB675_2748 [Phialophora attinorum]KPI44907.1 hypothetical protein AB675_2748 [Phialophora attinorum]
MLPLLFVLLGACAPSAASETSFSVTDDLFAYPQYQIEHSDDYILFEDALDLLDSIKVASLAHSGSDVRVVREDEAFDDDVAEYAMLTLHNSPYLCSIPRVSRAVANETQPTASEEDKQKELARAADKGRELLSGMQSNQCLFYSTGWWTYSFCYNQEVRQFHALSMGQMGGRTWPPQQDPTTPAFVLGKVDAETKDPATPKQDSQTAVSTELQTKAETSYLVQKLAGGTNCDLTGKDRKVEIEFHCNPQLTDRIGWIKEVSTCSYLMVVYTPRLCSDVAFMPPKDSNAYPIRCSRILHESEVSEWEAEREAEEAAATQLVQQDAETPLFLGNVHVGGMKYFKDGKKLEPGRIVLTPDERAETIMMQKDGKVSSISNAELKKLELEPGDIEKFRKQLEKLAGAKDWKIERTDDINGQVQLRGVVSEDEKKSSREEDTDDPATDIGSDGELEGSEEVFKEDL